MKVGRVFCIRQSADTSRNETERVCDVINPRPRQRRGTFQWCCRTRWRRLLISHSSRLVLGEGSWPTGPWLPWSCAGEKKKQGETSSYLGNVALGRIKGNLR